MTPTKSEDNARRWNGTETGQYEVWYITGNHIETGTGFWLRYTLESPLSGAPYVQLWFAHFDVNNPWRNFGINQRIPIGQHTASAEPFSLRMGGAELTGHSARGALEGNHHRVKWDIRWSSKGPTHRQLPDLMYRRGGLGETTVHTPALMAAISGTIQIDGVDYAFLDEPGCQTHLWGKKHAHRWAWGHCNAFEDEPTAAIECFSVNLERRGVVLPMLTLFSLYYRGKVYRFNQFRHTLLTRGSFETGRYAFSARDHRVKIEGEFRCRTEDLVLATYADPDGEASFCANTEVADLYLSLATRIGPGKWREEATLISRGAAHFETASRQRPVGELAEHVTVEL